MSEANQILGQIAVVRSRILEVFDTVDEPEQLRPTADGGWSIAEIVEHLVLAEDYGIRGLWGALESARKGESEPLPPEQSGRSIDDVFSGQPERVDAPDAVVPRSGGQPVGYWLDRFRAHQDAIASLAREMEQVGPERVIYPHFRVGALDGIQRLGFFRFHLDRHWRQIGRTLDRDSAGGPRQGG
ncbi:MAG: DinB family protein [Gemmatimonadota bacterium]